MTCPFNQWIRDPGQARLQVTRAANVNRLVLRLEDLDRDSGQSTATDHRTDELESGLPFAVAADHTYSLFLTAVRNSSDSPGQFRVDLELASEELLDNQQCDCDGSQPSGHWEILA